MSLSCVDAANAPRRKIVAQIRRSSDSEELWRAVVPSRSKLSACHSCGCPYPAWTRRTHLAERSSRRSGGAPMLKNCGALLFRLDRNSQRVTRADVLILRGRGERTSQKDRRADQEERR